MPLGSGASLPLPLLLSLGSRVVTGDPPVSSFVEMNMFFPQGDVILETYRLTTGQMGTASIRVGGAGCW